MWIQLIISRMMPLLVLSFCREKRNLKILISCICVSVLLLTGFALYLMVQKSGWESLLYLPGAMFPHSVCYVFSVWIVLRCVFREWSVRVWKRVYHVSVVLNALGVCMEYYLNPMILESYTKILKLFFKFT